jgi:hypothetical protein
VTTGLPKAFTHSYGSQRAMRQSMTQGQGLLADFRTVGCVERQMLELGCVSRGLVFRKASDEAPFVVGGASLDALRSQPWSDYLRTLSTMDSAKLL